MIPVTFDQCSGWLHCGRTNRGVVLMNPFGFEELCARKAYVHLAHMLEARGISVLRFDWSGTGDSLGSTLDGNVFERWRENAQAAIETLKREAQVQEISLVGLRLGALLATDAAVQRGDIRRLVLIAPPNSGRAWLREATAFGKMMAGEKSMSSLDGFSAAGFRLGHGAANAIHAWAWPQKDRPAPFIDIMNGANGSTDMLAEMLRISGATVTQGEFAGYDGMMCDPTASEIPMGTLQALASRIADNASLLEQPASPGAFFPLFGVDFAEAPAQIGPDGSIAGILCAPRHKGDCRDAVIMLNAGAVHHAGWARMHVDLARRLAHSGMASLRIDLPGIGDSALPGDAPVASLYSRKMTTEVSQAIDWLQERGYERITLVGACSGAYQAFHAALADERISQLVLLNQLCFVWSKTYALQMNAWQATKNRSVQAQMASERKAMGEAAQTLSRLMPFARKLAKSSFSALMSLQVHAANAFAAEKPVEAAFMTLAARGVRVLLAYSEGDAGLAELERHMGRNGERATALPGVEKKLIINADHMLTQQQAREDFSDMLVAFTAESADNVVPLRRQAG